MNKIIPFNKDITFKSNIKEIVSIALDNDLTLKGENKVVGNFYIKGEYREENDALTLEKYSYKIPVEIEISDKYDTYNATIDIDDFMYEVDNNILSVSIKVKIDNILKKESINVINNNIDKESKKEELKEEKEEEQDEIIDKLDNIMNERINDEAKINKVEKVKSSDKFLFLDKSNLDKKDDKYLTYFVYKVKEEDTINYVKEKYKVTIDDLSDYNDLEKFAPGVKLIIPSNKK